MGSIHGKRAALSLEKPEDLQMICKALSSPLRLDIMRALWKRSMNVGELAEELNQPMSTTALAVKVLEDAGIIKTEVQPSTRGTMKICTRKLDYIGLELTPREEQQQTTSISLMMPIGGYSIAEGVQPTCGLASKNAFIGEMDTVNAFYLPERFNAQLVWFQEGMLEYRFSCSNYDELDFNWLELSFEACSEAPMYRNPWKSDIAVEINGKRLGIWTSPADCGGRRGVLTPEWWAETNTQYGYLKTWRVDDSGTYVDNERVSRVNISQLHLKDERFITVRIGIPEDAENHGGLNLFGESFGDYPQALLMKIGYQIHP